MSRPSKRCRLRILSLPLPPSPSPSYARLQTNMLFVELAPWVQDEQLQHELLDGFGVKISAGRCVSPPVPDTRTHAHTHTLHPPAHPPPSAVACEAAPPSCHVAQVLRPALCVAPTCASKVRDQRRGEGALRAAQRCLRGRRGPHRLRHWGGAHRHARASWEGRLIADGPGVRRGGIGAK